nr:uncharacterized protein LOC129280721 [Lytechinus pictus]
MDSAEPVPERKMAVQGHGVSTCSQHYELLTTKVSICSVIAITGKNKVVLLHADSSIKEEDIQELVNDLKTDVEDDPNPKISYVCSSKDGYVEMWMDIMGGLLPEFCYPHRSRIKFSAGKFGVCSLDESMEDYYHLPKSDLIALVDTECLWASLYFTDSIRFGPVLLDTMEDLTEGLIAAGNALSVVHLLSFDGIIKEIQVDAFLRRYWKSTILGRFLEEFSPNILPLFEGMTHLSVAEVLSKDQIKEEDKKKVEDIVVDYGILVLSFLDNLKDYAYPNAFTGKQESKASAPDSPPSKSPSSKSPPSKSPPSNSPQEKTNGQQPGRPSRRGSHSADTLGPLLFEESFKNVKISNDGPPNQPRPRRASAIKLYEKKR